MDIDKQEWIAQTASDLIYDFNYDMTEAIEEATKMYDRFMSSDEDTECGE